MPRKDSKRYVANIDLFKFLQLHGTGIKPAIEEKIQDRVEPTLKLKVDKKK
jgi:hypothetical protein